MCFLEVFKRLRLLEVWCSLLPRRAHDELPFGSRVSVSQLNLYAVLVHVTIFGFETFPCMPFNQPRLASWTIMWIWRSSQLDGAWLHILGHAKPWCKFKKLCECVGSHESASCGDWKYDHVSDPGLNSEFHDVAQIIKLITIESKAQKVKLFLQQSVCWGWRCCAWSCWPSTFTL